MKKRLIAVLTTAVMFTSAAALPPVQAGDEPLMDSVIGTLPDWTPLNFADAMEFYNTYGKTHVEDNFICLVKPVRLDEKDKYKTSYSGSMALVNTPACTSPALFKLEIPEKPDPNDEEAFAEYEELCNKLGIPTDDYTFFEDYAKSEAQYVFKVQMFHVLEGHDLTIEWIEDLGEGYKKKIIDTFTFENPSGFIEQTDIYSWLPDCPAEYTWLKSYSLNSTLAASRACVYPDPYTHIPYIAYCADVNASTGASLEMEQSGDGAIEYVMESDCNGFDFSSQLGLIDGGGSSSVIVYQPTKDGLVDVEWSVGNHWSDEASFDITIGRYHITDNCSAIVDLSSGSTIITFIDADTGKLIDIPENSSYLKNTIQHSPDEPCLSELFPIDSNPCVIDSLRAYDPHCSYSFDIRTEDGYYDFHGFEVTSETSNRIQVTCRLKWNVIGDANGDGVFGIADVVLLQKWLLGEPNITFADWTAANFYHDGQLDALDLCCMKQYLIEKRETSYVKPEKTIEYGGPLRVTADSLKFYLGPDESYKSIAVIPKDTLLYEMGYQNNNEYWLFTKYEGQFGWIRIFAEDNKTMTVFFEVYAAKPVIYLYPEQETDVRVQLELTESELSTTYPKYLDGWDVVAYPDGTLLNKADGTHHKYLFWDSKNCRTRFDFSKGFCVAGSDTESFLKEKLTYMGLTEQEMNEFIVYWLPIMEHNAYNLISFQGDAYTDSARLRITPSPDSICRIFMTYVPLTSAVEIAPQELETFERKGFAVVEWGGAEIHANINS